TPSPDVQLIWNRFGKAQIDLFASHESTHWALWYSLTEAPLGTDALVHSWPRGPRKYALCTNPNGCPLLAQPDLVHGPRTASISSSLAKTLFLRGRAQYGTRTQISGTCTWSSETYHQRQLYALKWLVFTRRCTFRGPQREP
ncbi:hypothetical protein M9458_018421, partial [Cirrhinus mrigala]